MNFKTKMVDWIPENIENKTIHLLEENLGNIFTYDYKEIRESMITSDFFREFQEYYGHPKRVVYYLINYNYDILYDEVWEHDGTLL